MPPSPSPTPVLVELANTADGVPWWGVPVIAGAFLIVGAALGFWFNWILEGRRARREDLRKWDDRILELTVDVAAKVDAFARVASTKGREADGRARLLRDGLIQEEEESAKALREVASFADVGMAMLQIGTACTALELIAPSDVGRLASDLRQVELSAHPEAGLSAMAPIIEAVESKRQMLVESVRKHFGIR